MFSPQTDELIHPPILLNKPLCCVWYVEPEPKKKVKPMPAVKGMIGGCMLCVSKLNSIEPLGLNKINISLPI